MTADEQSAYRKQLAAWTKRHLPKIEQAVGGQWTVELTQAMQEGMTLLAAWTFARDFAEQATLYGDYAARAYRMRFYVDKINKECDTLAPAEQPRKPGRPASAATIARREAEAKAAEKQVALFQQGSPAGDGDYRLSIAQKRMLLSPDLAQRSENIRNLRTLFANAAEKAKTLAELGRPASEIEPYADEAACREAELSAIFTDIDAELAVLWYRLQNDSPEWRSAWLQKYGFKSIDDVHDDLKHDLRKHYTKVQSPDFDLRCQTLIEQESPEYIEKQKADAERKKEVQEIIRYFKRKDKAQKLDTARQKFKRLEELLGKKEAANYRPLLTKVEDDAKKAEKSKKAPVPESSASGKTKTKKQ